MLSTYLIQVAVRLHLYGVQSRNSIVDRAAAISWALGNERLRKNVVVEYYYFCTPKRRAVLTLARCQERRPRLIVRLDSICLN